MYIALTQSIHWQVGLLKSPEVIDNALSNQDKDKYEPKPKFKNTEIYDETRESVEDIGHEQCKYWSHIGILKITMKKLGIRENQQIIQGKGRSRMWIKKWQRLLSKKLWKIQGNRK